MDLDQAVLRMPHKSNARMPAHANDPAARSKCRSSECVFEKAPLDAGLSVGEVCSEVPGLTFEAFQLLDRDFQLLRQVSYAAS
jgi:hypothetical protein